MHALEKAVIPAVCLLLTLQILSQTAGAQTDSFRVNVYLDKVAYSPLDEIVEIAGCLLSGGTSVLGRQVSVQVYGPEGDVVISEEAPVDENCNFGVGVDTRSLSEHGNYVVVATHETASDKKPFRFSDETNQKLKGECADDYCTYAFELQGRIYQIQYKLTSGTLDSIVVDLPARALEFLVNSTTSNGTLIVILPRDIIDSSQNMTDIRYKVFIGNLADGVEHVVHEELAVTDNDRTVAVNYPASRDRILITINGTYLAPELGSVVVISAAIFGIVAMLSRFFNQTKTKR